MAKETGENRILKIGLAVIRDGKLLVARKRGKTLFILPGGRPEGTESDIATLTREITEELQCILLPDTLVFEGEFSDQAANEPNTIVTVRLYLGDFVGVARASAEIEEIRWIDQDFDEQLLARSITRQIIPYLHSKSLL